MSQEFVKIATAAGKVEAEIIRSLLEANDIQVQLLYESAGTAIGLGVGPLAEVDILVRADQQAQAEDLLGDYYSGNLETDDPADGG